MELMTSYNISLDLIKSNYVVIKAKQYDKNSRQIIVHCTLNGEEYKLPNNIKAITQMTKSDGNPVNTNCRIDVNKNVIIIDMTEQMTSVDGTIDAEIVLISVEEESVLSTMKFNIIVYKSSINKSQIVSSSEFETLADLVLQCEDLADSVGNIEKEMISWEDEEKIRQSNENERKDNEVIRQENEEIRESNENERQLNEESRESQETVRKENEIIRNTSEDERKKQESLRQDNEAMRQKNEADRQANENARQALENARNVAETRREADTYEAINNINAVKESIETKLANGEFDGRTVLYGSGTPSNDYGKNGDIYVNISYVEPYPFYLFVKDENEWTPICKMRGIDGTDTLPLLGTMFLPSDKEIPVGYEEVEEPAIPTSVIVYKDRSLNTYIEELEERIKSLEQKIM